MIYAFLKFLAKTASRIFFSKITINHIENIPSKGPLIIVANHPNTFMDPILIATMLKQQVYFLAKSTVFGSPVKDWILGNILNMIPVYRKQDLPPGEASNNNAVFEKCFQFLAKGGTLLIFPEGTSIMEQKLREIKTGTARIGLGCEATHQFNLGVKILPIGLNYSDGEQFRSKVFINIAEPIEVKNRQETYEKDEREAVTQLTEQIRIVLENQMILVKDKEHERMLKQAGNIFEQELADNTTLPEHSIQKGMAEALDYFSENDITFTNSLKQKLNIYFRKLNYIGLQDQLLSKKNLQSNVFKKASSVLIFLILGLPLWLFGIVSNYLPYIIPAKVAAKVSPHIEYRAPVMMVTGMFTFGIYYFISTFLLFHFVQNMWLIFIYIPLAILCGFFVLYYWNVVEENITNLKLLFLFRKEKELIQSLINERKDIYNHLKEARDRFVNKQA